MRGFTIMESLITMTVFSIIMMGLYNVFDTASLSYPVDSGLLNLQQEVRQGMHWLTRETRESSSATITTLSATHDTITFNTPTETGVQYYVNATKLLREYPPGTTKTITNDISRLKFSQTGKLLDIQLEARAVVARGPLTFSLHEEVRLRNE